MTHAEMLAELRQLIGSPGLDQVTNRALESRLWSAADSLADSLGYRVVTQTNMFALTAGTYEHALPADLNRILWVRWNGKFLDAGDLRAWQRDKKDWRTATSGNPSAFAVEGRSLILFPPPSADAITTDGYLDMSFLACAAAPASGGTAGLSDSDLWCLIFKAAVEWLGVNPSQDNAIRFQTCGTELLLRVDRAKARHAEPVVQQHKSIRWANRRSGAAR